MNEVLEEYYCKQIDQLLESLQDLNSKYPATQEFLKQRGLTNVRQLDAQGREDLLTHLRDVLRKLRN